MCNKLITTVEEMWNPLFMLLSVFRLHCVDILINTRDLSCFGLCLIFYMYMIFAFYKLKLQLSDLTHLYRF